MPHIGGKVGCNTPTSRSLWAPHVRYPCRCWYKRAGSRRSCSKYHELVRALRQLAVVIPYADLHNGHNDLDDAGVGTSLWIANKLQVAVSRDNQVIRLVAARLDMSLQIKSER